MIEHPYNQTLMVHLSISFFLSPPSHDSSLLLPALSRRPRRPHHLPPPGTNTDALPPPPTFAKPQWLIHKEKKFYEFYRIPEQERIRFASFHLCEATLDWWLDLTISKNYPHTWKEFLTSIQLRFGANSKLQDPDSLTTAESTDQESSITNQQHMISNNDNNLAIQKLQQK